MADARSSTGRACKAILVRGIVISFFAGLAGVLSGMLVALPFLVAAIAEGGNPIAALAGLAFVTVLAAASGWLVSMKTLWIFVPLLLATDLRRSIPRVLMGAVLGTLWAFLDSAFFGQWLGRSEEFESTALFVLPCAGGFVGWLVGALRWRGAYFVDPRGEKDLAWLYRRRVKRPPRRAPPLLRPFPPT